MSLNDCDPVGSSEIIDPSLTLASVTLSGSSLTSSSQVVPALKATWTASTNPAVGGIQFEYVASDASAGPTRSAPQGNTLQAWVGTDGVMAGKSYVTRWRAVGSAAGTYGDWSTPATITPAGSMVSGTIVGQAPAATDFTIQPGATNNNTFYSLADPTTYATVTDGDLWYSTTIWYLRTGGAWVQTAAPTAEILDASLNTPVPSLLGSSITQSGITLPALRASWTASGNANVAGIQFEYVPTDATSGAIRTPMQGNTLLGWCATDGVIAGKSYATRYRSVGIIPNTFGSWSSPTTLTPSATMVAGTVVGQAPAATDSSIQPGATNNNTYYSVADPTTYATVTNGDLWYSGTVWYLRDGGAWVQVAAPTAEILDTSLTTPVPTITGSSITSGSQVNSAIKASWTASGNANVLGVQFEYVPSDATSGPIRTAVQGNALLAWTATDGLVAGKSYNVRSRPAGIIPHTFGSWTSPTTVTPTSLGVATYNAFFTGTTDPATLGTVPDGALWYNGTVYYARVSGAWVQTAAPTGEVTDASLNTPVPSIFGGALTSGSAVLPCLGATWTASGNANVLGIQFEYVPTDATAGPIRTGMQGNSLLAWTATDGVMAGKTYAVRYRSVGKIPHTYGSWSSPANYTPSSTIIAHSIVGQANAATDATIQAGATINSLYYTGTDPATVGTVMDGAFWFDTGTANLYFRLSGSWSLIAHLATTLTDGTVMFDSSTAGAFSFPIPSNALTHVDIYVFGGGGGAGVTHGGGGSGYSKYLNLAVTAGTTVIAGTIGGGGRGADPGVPLTALAGTASTITSPAITANGGGSGQSGAGGAGGASGGTTNTTGEAGNTGGTGNGGANLGSGTYTGGARQTTSGGAGNPPGGGGAANASNGGRGANGRVVIITRT